MWRRQESHVPTALQMLKLYVVGVSSGEDAPADVLERYQPLPAAAGRTRREEGGGGAAGARVC